MSPEQWTKIRTVFEEALSLSPAERELFLIAECGSDTDIRHAVEELVSNYCEERNFSDPKIRVFQKGDVVAGRFQIARFISSGGMGEVYEVCDLRLQLRLALKTLREDVSQTSGALSRFEREICVAREVAHANVCKVFEFVEHSFGERLIPCLIMELIEGRSLAEHLRDNRPLSPDLALPLLKQIASALDSLHCHGIIHRDLKPSNIMLAQTGNQIQRAVLMDFGLAKQMASHDGLFSPTHTVQAGAPYFMAPELLQGGQPSVASDIYAFGLVIDETVTPARAFTAQSVQALCYAKLWERPLAPSERMPSLPAAWEQTIERCIHRDPAQRFHTAGEAVQTLESVTFVKAGTGRSFRLSRRVILGMSGTACTAIVAALVDANLFSRTSRATVSVFEVENQSAVSSYDYLCRGITYELLRMLTRLDQMHVVPMHSSRSSAHGSVSDGFVLYGSLQAHGEHVRLQMALGDSGNGQLIWSQNFDRVALANQLEMQSEIATGAMMAMQSAVQRAAIRRGAYSFRGWIPDRVLNRSSLAAKIAVPPTNSNVALDAYMLGQHLLARSSPDSLQSAIKELTRAITEDPRFALAYASLSYAYVALSHYNYIRRSELYESARQFAEASVLLDAQSAECHEALALVRQSHWDWRGAEQSYLQALLLKPRLASARRRYAGLLIQLGRTKEGVTMTREAFQQDPYHPSAPAGHGLYLFLARHYDEALAVLQPAAQRPNALAACHNLGDVYAIKALQSTGLVRDRFFRQAFEQATRVAEIETRFRLDPRIGTPWSDQMFANYHSLRKQAGKAEPYLKRMLKDMNAGSASAANVAIVYVAQDRPDEALDALERSVACRDQYVPLARVMPFLAPLHGMPRFKHLLKQMKF